MINLLIADDHPIMAEGIRKLLDKDIRCKGISHTLAETAEQLQRHQPDILLLDLALPDGDALDHLPLLRTASPHTHIILLTMYAEAAVIHRALQANVDGYLTKNIRTDELNKAIHTVAAGTNYVADEARASLAAAQQENLPELTAREREILSLMAQGMTMKEIAEHLFLAFETVHSYTKYIRQKLGCNNTASLIRTAINQHLI